MSNDKVKMEQIAKLAGVSLSTVSRGLSGSGRMSEKTRERILEISRDVGYNVNAHASNLRRQSSGSLGLVIPLAGQEGHTVHDPFFTEIIASVTTAATEYGYDVIVSLPSTSGSISQRRLLSCGKVDALIVIGQTGNHDLLNARFIECRPFVGWGGLLDDQSYPTIGGDNFEGGRLAASYLIEKGCRKLVFIGDRNLPEVGLRYNGFCHAHKEHEVSLAEVHSIDAPFGNRVSSRELLTNMFNQDHQFDGVCAASDMLAIAAIQSLTAIGRSVPDDVKVVGYDNIEIADLYSPRLTTIHQDIKMGGRLLVEAAIRLAEDGQRPTSVLLPTYITSRESA